MPVECRGGPRCPLSTLSDVKRLRHHEPRLYRSVPKLVRRRMHPPARTAAHSPPHSRLLVDLGTDAQLASAVAQHRCIEQYTKMGRGLPDQRPTRPRRSIEERCWHGSGAIPIAKDPELACSLGRIARSHEYGTARVSRATAGRLKTHAVPSLRCGGLCAAQPQSTSGPICSDEGSGSCWPVLLSLTASCQDPRTFPQRFNLISSSFSVLS